MHFARSEYLYFFWGLPLLALFLYGSLQHRRRRLERLVSASLIPELTREFSRTRAYLRAVLLLGCVAFIILALARPQWGARMETVRRRGVDIVIALDTSYSMNTEDVAPSRLEKAKSEIRNFVDHLKGDRVGLVTFAGMAVIQCPLTLDYGAIRLFLDSINTQIIPEPGTALSAAIRTASSTFNSREKKYKVLVIFTDGEDLEGEIDAALREAKEGGVIIYTVGLGSAEGQPIPVRNQQGDIVEYKKDAAGQVVVSRLDERTLARIASECEGRYFRATTSENELETLYGEISRLDKKELDSRLVQNFEDRFQYPLGTALLFLITELWLRERRKPGRAT